METDRSKRQLSNSLRWPIDINNSVDKMKITLLLPPSSTVSLETYPLHSLILLSLSLPYFNFGNQKSSISWSSVRLTPPPTPKGHFMMFHSINLSMVSMAKGVSRQREEMVR